MVVDHFCGWVAEHYDDSAAETFDQAVVQPVVDPLADPTGTGSARELGACTIRIALTPSVPTTC
jgi:hypothetical protein